MALRTHPFRLCGRQHNVVDVTHDRVERVIVVDQWMRVSSDSGLRHALNIMQDGAGLLS